MERDYLKIIKSSAERYHFYDSHNKHYVFVVFNLENLKAIHQKSLSLYNKHTMQV